MQAITIDDFVFRVFGGSDGDGGGDGPGVVLMHGFGAPGDDLVPFAQAIDVPPGTRFIFPQAPLQLGPMFGGGRAWWMIDIARLEQAIASGNHRDMTNEAPDDLIAIAEKLGIGLGELQSKIGLDPKRTLLGGFSQGGMVAAQLAFSTAIPVAGLVLLSTTFLNASQWKLGMAERSGTEVFQSHGRADPLLSFDIAESLRDEMKEKGLAVDWHAFNGGHEIPPTVLGALSAFSTRMLS